MIYTRLIVIAATCVLVSTTQAADQRFFDSSGVQISFTDEGHGDAVILVHGYAGNADWWRDHGVTVALVDAGFRVIALDCRGHGRSDRPKQRDAYGIEMVGDIQRLMDHCGIDRAHIVGYSMGAVIVRKYLERHAKRVQTATIAGYGRPPLPERYSAELVAEIEANLRAMGLLETNDPQALASISVGWHEWAIEGDALKRDSTPVLALVGRKDPFLEDTRALVEGVPGMRMETLPGDHGTLPSHPEFVAKLIEHLRAASLK